MLLTPVIFSCFVADRAVGICKSCLGMLKLPIVLCVDQRADMLLREACLLRSFDYWLTFNRHPELVAKARASSSVNVYKIAHVTKDNKSGILTESFAHLRN